MMLTALFYFRAAFDELGLVQAAGPFVIIDGVLWSCW